jgi:hypothetical protein
MATHWTQKAMQIAEELAAVWDEKRQRTHALLPANGSKLTIVVSVISGEGADNWVWYVARQDATTPLAQGEAQERTAAVRAAAAAASWYVSE